jgi:hypothetical protein
MRHFLALSIATVLTLPTQHVHGGQDGSQPEQSHCARYQGGPAKVLLIWYHIFRHIPQTWEDPEMKSMGYGGDNEPIDAIEFTVVAFVDGKYHRLSRFGRVGID